MPGRQSSRQFLYKLVDMEELRRFILESHIDPALAKTVYDSLCLFEAVNINKDFLVREAGSREKFDRARADVQRAWKSEGMDGQMNPNTSQKVLNLLYLMEIRKPGFTDAGKLHSIHDLYIHNMLDTKFLNAVNSETTPEQAEDALSAAVEHQSQQQKAYPGLSAEEEAIWNRVKVYHEFPDGFRWVYAVDAQGKIASHIPSSVTSKTMHHCGNSPRAKSDDQYWELRDAEGKAYLTVILNRDGELEESKSWGNQVSKYRTMIQPYVKWFLMDRVKGVGRRYDYGYSTHTNYGVKDFIGDDPEFIEYVTEYKPELLGNTEEKILFWQGAVEEGVVSKEQMKQLFVDDIDMDTLMKNPGVKRYAENSRFKYDKSGMVSSSSSVLGANRFDVLCAACGECPFDEEELEKLVYDDAISLEEFVNYDIRLLTPEMQRAFVKHDPSTFRKIFEIAEQVASFKVDERLVESLIEPFYAGEADGALILLRYLAEANPPEKVHSYAKTVFGNDAVLTNIFADRDARLAICSLEILQRFPDIAVGQALPSEIDRLFALQANNLFYVGTTIKIVENILSLDSRRMHDILRPVSTKTLLAVLHPKNGYSMPDRIRLVGLLAKLVKLFGPDFAIPPGYLATKQLKLMYLMSAAKEGMDVPGLDTLGPAILAGVRAVTENRVSKAVGDSLILYMLGISSHPSLCDRLEPGKLAMFMTVAANPGHAADWPEDMVTPEIIFRCKTDLEWTATHPDRKLITRLAKEMLFQMMEMHIVGDTPTPEMNTLLCSLLHIRAAVMGKPNSFDWPDSTNINTLVNAGFITIPAEDWPEWCKVMGEEYFIKLYMGGLGPERIYSDDTAMSCIVRLLTGHGIFCSDEELKRPGNDNDVYTRYRWLLGFSSHTYDKQMAKVISGKLSSMILDGKVGLTPDVLEQLSRNGLVGAKAYRVATESLIANQAVPVEDMDITPGQIWKLIRSPRLPELVYNNIRRLFEMYVQHSFQRLDEYQISTKIRDLCMKLVEKQTCYQVMKTVQMLVSSGLVDRMLKYCNEVDNSRTPEQTLGYDYDDWMAGRIIAAVRKIVKLDEWYRSYPVPEPKTAKARRKT